MNRVCLDGQMIAADQPVLLADNRSYRYGDGLFETMKWKEGRILLEDYHFERLFSGLDSLGFTLPAHFTREKLSADVSSLCEANDCRRLARVRLSVSRGNGSLTEKNATAITLIECWPLDASAEELNQTGFVVDIYPDARKNCDIFSKIKSANCLPYVMAARYAQRNRLDDALVLNSYNNIAEASIANIFLVKGRQLLTPSLEEGCVGGVVRRWILERYPVTECPVQLRDILAADEVFLTNAIYGVRWVAQFRNMTYAHLQASAIHRELKDATWVDKRKK